MPTENNTENASFYQQMVASKIFSGTTRDEKANEFLKSNMAKNHFFSAVQVKKFEEKLE